MTSRPTASANLPLVSVAMATYNGEAFLERQIDTIFSQTYPNIEIVACDDQSTDGTQEILRRYEASGRLRCFVNERNLGVKENFAKAASLCDGDFIAFADQDDAWLPNRIEVFMSCIGDGTLVYGPALQMLNANEDTWPVPDISHYCHFCREAERAGFFARAAACNWIAGHQMLFRREVLRLALPIPAEQPCHDAWLALVASTAGQVVLVSDGLMYYRQHAASVTYAGRHDASRNIKAKLLAMQVDREASRAEIARLRSILPLPSLTAQMRRWVADLIRWQECRITRGPHFLAAVKSLFHLPKYFNLKSKYSKIVFFGQIFLGTYAQQLIRLVVGPGR